MISSFFSFLLLSVIAASITATSALPSLTFEPNQVTLLNTTSPASTPPKVQTSSQCRVFTRDAVDPNNACIGDWFEGAEAEFQIPSTSFTEPSQQAGNTISFRYKRTVENTYRDDLVLRVSILDGSSGDPALQTFDFTPKVSSLFHAATHRLGFLKSISLPVAFTLKPNSIISIKVVRGDDKKGAWRLLNVYVNNPALPKFKDIDIKTFATEPLHCSTYNEAHSVSSYLSPRTNTADSLRIAASDCFSFGSAETRLFFGNPKTSSSQTENVGIGWWTYESFISFIIPHDWTGFLPSSVWSAPSFKSRKVQFVVHYARDGEVGKLPNKNDAALKFELRTSSAEDEVHGRTNPESMCTRHQDSTPEQYLQLPPTGGWFLDKSQLIVAPGEFEITPYSTLNITTVRNEGTRGVGNIFNIFAVPVELVEAFVGGKKTSPSSTAEPTAAPTTVAPTSASPPSSASAPPPTTTLGGSSSSFSSGSSASAFVSTEKYNEMQTSYEHQEELSIGLGVALGLSLLTLLIIGLLYCSRGSRIEELEHKLQKFEKQQQQLFGSGSGSTDPTNQHHQFFNPTFPSPAAHHQATMLPTQGVVVVNSSSENSAFSDNNNNAKKNNNQQQQQPQQGEFFVPDFGYQRRSYALSRQRKPSL